MAGFITFDISKLDRTWSSANWVYTSFLDHVINHVADENEAVERLTASKYNQSLSLSRLMEDDPKLCARIIESLKYICSQVANRNCLASVNGNELDEESQDQYREAIKRLNDLLVKEYNREDKSI